MAANLDNAKYWRDRAAETRVIAEHMTNPKTAETLDGIARDYDALARMADEREEMRKRFEQARKA